VQSAFLTVQPQAEYSFLAIFFLFALAEEYIIKALFAASGWDLASTEGNNWLPGYYVLCVCWYWTNLFDLLFQRKN
jgi:hypothetical protein